MLVEEPLTLSASPLPRAATQLIEEGRSRYETVHCFHFVPSNCEMVDHQPPSVSSRLSFLAGTGR